MELPAHIFQSLTGANFVREMSAGKGYIALAAVIFGNWRPIRAFWACLMFGFLDAITSRLQDIDLPLIGEVPAQLMSALPYIMTIILVVRIYWTAKPSISYRRPLQEMNFLKGTNKHVG